MHDNFFDELFVMNHFYCQLDTRHKPFFTSLAQLAETSHFEKLLFKEYDQFEPQVFWSDKATHLKQIYEYTEHFFSTNPTKALFLLPEKFVEPSYGLRLAKKVPIAEEVIRERTDIIATFYPFSFKKEEKEKLESKFTFHDERQVNFALREATMFATNPVAIVAYASNQQGHHPINYTIVTIPSPD